MFEVWIGQNQVLMHLRNINFQTQPYSNWILLLLKKVYLCSVVFRRILIFWNQLLLECSMILVLLQPLLFSNLPRNCVFRPNEIFINVLNLIYLTNASNVQCYYLPSEVLFVNFGSQNWNLDHIGPILVDFLCFVILEN